MIFVTVGSQKFPFDRLLEEIDCLIIDGTITTEVFAQTGNSTYIPQQYDYQPFMDQGTFEENMQKCDILITHGGTGVIVSALKMGKKVIAIPRLAKYNEHVDDHQVELLTQFKEQDLICYCNEVTELKKAVKEINDCQFKPFTSNTTVYLEELDQKLLMIQDNELKKKKKQQKLNKYIEYFTTKARILLKQKTHHYENTSIHYLEESNNSDTLIIVFSSCTRKAVKARYNYVRTLKNIKADKLFVLDDYGFDQRGVYYLGKEMDWVVERAVADLIQERLAKEYQHIIFAGSSKGGYGALNFGLEVPRATIIVGAPQYKVGEFFMDPANQLEGTLKYVTGEDWSSVTKTQLEALNNHLKAKIIKNKDQASEKNIVLHYSDQEHTYEEHIKDLVRDLNEWGYKISSDIESYTNHSEISLYFPAFLLENIQKSIEGDKR